MANQERVQLFAEALESGRFVQGRNTLHTDIGTDHESHCCLGVAIIVAAEAGFAYPHRDYGENRFYLAHHTWLSVQKGKLSLDDLDETHFYNNTELPPAVCDWYGFEAQGDPSIIVEGHEGNTSAIHANDELGMDFATIAAGFRHTYLTEEPEDPSGVLEP